MKNIHKLSLCITLIITLTLLPSYRDRTSVLDTKVPESPDINHHVPIQFDGLFSRTSVKLSALENMFNTGFDGRKSGITSVAELLAANGNIGENRLRNQSLLKQNRGIFRGLI